MKKYLGSCIPNWFLFSHILNILRVVSFQMQTKMIGPWKGFRATIARIWPFARMFAQVPRQFVLLPSVTIKSQKLSNKNTQRKREKANYRTTKRPFAIWPQAYVWLFARMDSRMSLEMRAFRVWFFTTFQVHGGKKLLSFAQHLICLVHSLTTVAANENASFFQIIEVSSFVPFSFAHVNFTIKDVRTIFAFTFFFYLQISVRPTWFLHNSCQIWLIETVRRIEQVFELALVSFFARCIVLLMICIDVGKLIAVYMVDEWFGFEAVVVNVLVRTWRSNWIQTVRVKRIGCLV